MPGVVMSTAIIATTISNRDLGSGDQAGDLKPGQDWDRLARRNVRCARHCRPKLLISSISGLDPERLLGRLAGCKMAFMP
jgi:hypothetical protein